VRLAAVPAVGDPDRAGGSRRARPPDSMARRPPGRLARSGSRHRRGSPLGAECDRDAAAHGTVPAKTRRRAPNAAGPARRI